MRQLLKLNFICLAVAGLLLASAAAGQGVTAKVKVHGTVTSTDGDALPGVTVTLKSPVLQGDRVVMTDNAGNYNSPPLPPGEYQVGYELDGFQSVNRNVRLSAGVGAVEIDQQLTVGIEEEIIVTGEATQVVSEKVTASQTITQETLESLPLARNLDQAVLLAGGTRATGPGDNITINGAQSWENLFTMDGVVLNENIRGQAFTLYIEDAIQETTTESSGVSAEYGRFTGGVVTAVTKSGGNEFSGSFRASLDNDDWKSENDLSPDERVDKTNETYEATLGGRVVRDRLWFFGAGRDRETAETATTSIFNSAYSRGSDQQRVQAKLTGAITSEHQVQVTYTDIDHLQTNVPHGGLSGFALVTDDGSLSDRALPQELVTANYTGVITSNFFVEGLWSERKFAFAGGGGADQTFPGNPTWDIPNGVIYNESIFCDSNRVAGCINEDRDNENLLVKGSYFLSTTSAGSHDLVFGYDTFTDIRSADNHQSANDWMVWNFAPSTFRNPVVTPNYAPGATTMVYLPILEPTQGTDFVTNSLYINDRWQLNNKWSFNIGLRYDENDSVNSLGEKISDDNEISPRLGLSYDVRGDGNWVLNAAFGRYVGAIANGVANDTSPAGTPATFQYIYLGPAISNVATEPATGAIYDWLFAFPGCSEADIIADPFACPLLISADVPGGTSSIPSALKSTSADEFSIGFAKRLGNGGSLRVDYVNREWNNFYASFVNLGTGQGVSPSGAPFDLAEIGNEDQVRERSYDAINLLGTYRFGDLGLTLGGNLSWSHARGTFNGETGGSGPVTGGATDYPEYREARWNHPRGDLSIDQRWKGRLWAIYDIFDMRRHRLNVALLQSYFSGTPYEAVGTIDPTPFVNNPGYATPDSTVDYFFSPRGAFTTDNVTRTDLSFNYALRVGSFEIFVQPEIINLFNEDSVESVNDTVVVLDPFNPFTSTPVEGEHYRFGDNFGQPTEEDDLQAVREYRFSVGFRF